MANIQELLQKRLKNENNELVRYIINDIIEKGEDALTYMKDVADYGCVSGIVGSLIYTKDTHAFFDRYYNEIEDLRVNLLDEGIDVLSYIKDSDLKNHMAWMVYEEVVRKLLNELEAEIPS